MAGKAQKHGAFRDYLTALADRAPLAKLHLVSGGAEMLAQEATQHLRRKATTAGLQTTAVEAPTLTEASFLSLCRQSSLFEPATFYLLRRVEAAKALPKLLAQLKSADSLQNPICLVTKAILCRRRWPQKCAD